MCCSPQSFGTAATISAGSLLSLLANPVILPILNSYRKYYGRRMTVLLAAKNCACSCVRQQTEIPTFYDDLVVESVSVLQVNDSSTVAHQVVELNSAPSLHKVAASALARGSGVFPF
jgi:hypothetical protein